MSGMFVRALAIVVQAIWCLKIEILKYDKVWK